jgi:protocatechuate 3,4-dioxygenase beta subunit
MTTQDREAGLGFDIERMLGMTASRRTSLRWLLAGAACPIASCGGAAMTPGTVIATTATGTGGGATTTAARCAVIPEETAGPYPADGTNSSAGGVANALALTGIVRSDIRSSVAGATGIAAGVPLTIRLQLVNVGAACASVAGAAVYLWHCDRAGAYSMYSNGIKSENYLRGVQAADGNGVVTFTTIVPGCYAGRMPHVHFEGYPSLDRAASAANRIRASQFTFPMAILNATYAAAGYEASVTGSLAEGYVASLTVGVFL